MSLTSVTVSGTVKKKPEQKSINGSSLITFMMNILKYDNKEKQEKQYSVKVNLWGEGFAENFDKLQEGSKIVVAGRLQIDQFNDKNGKAIKLFAIDASRVTFVDELRATTSIASANDYSSSTETDAFEEQELPF